MISCREAFRLLAEAQDRGLSLPTRIRLRLHISMCRLCRLYSRQLDFLKRTARALSGAHEDDSLVHLKLPPEAKEAIKRSLRQE